MARYKSKSDISKFRLPRKTKKAFKYFECEVSKRNWRGWYNKLSWKQYLHEKTFTHYPYTQEGWNDFCSDKRKGFKCEYCYKNIFEWGGEPNYHKEYNDLMCDDCYNDEFREYCPVCENSYDKEDFSKYFFISKRISKEVGKEPGMYKILSYPLYYGNCVTGFDAFFDNALEKVSDLDINEVLSITRPGTEHDIKLDCICPECAKRYLRNHNYIKAEPVYCILLNSERNKLFADYSEKRIHQIRQDMIHRRITFRGILQNNNN